MATGELTRMDPAEVEALIGRQYAKELAACDGLVDAYLKRCEPTWTGRNGTNEADRIVVAEMGRQTKTYKASLELARRGYGEQAAMLNRALFESMGVIRWVDANADEAADRYARAKRWEEYQQATRATNSGLLDDGDEIVLERALDLSPTEIADFTTGFGAYNERMWTGTGNIIGLFESVKDQFTAEEWKVVDNFRRLAHTENNQLLHSTVGGLDQALLPLEGGYGVWTAPSDQLIFKALFGAFFSYNQSLELYTERFELDDLEGIEKQTLEASYVFEPMPAGTEKPGRNDPCWCGSGKKYKKCHGA